MVALLPQLLSAIPPITLRAMDTAANLYIADYNNRRIRKVTAKAQIIRTIIGDGTNCNTGDGG